MRYIVGTDRFEASDAADLVRQMHLAAPHAREESDELFMEATARRTFMQNGVVLRIDTAENFIRGLMDAGMVKEG